MKKIVGVVVIAIGCALLVVGILALMSHRSHMAGVVDMKVPIGLGGFLVCLITGVRLLMPAKPF